MSTVMVLLVNVGLFKSQLDLPATERLEIPLKNGAVEVAQMLNSERCQRVMSCL